MVRNFQVHTPVENPAVVRLEKRQGKVRLVAEGDEAILFGPGTRGEPTAQDWADLLDTIHYEVVTSPRGRITRTYREAENR